MSSKKYRRYKLLLDEGLHLPSSYPKLNNFHDVLHIANTKNKSMSDKAIFQIAEKEGRLPVVFNTKHFKPLITKNSISVISLSVNLTDKEADLKICRTLRVIAKNQLKGCLIAISKSGVSIKIPNN